MIEATTQSLINMCPLCIHFQVRNKILPNPQDYYITKELAKKKILMLFARFNGMATVFIATTSRPPLRDGMAKAGVEWF